MYLIERNFLSYCLDVGGWQQLYLTNNTFVILFDRVTSIFPCETALMNNKIYITKDKKILIFDIVNQSWSQASPLPEPLDDLAAVVINRWIVFTGTNIDDYNSYTFVYDTHSQQWRQVIVAISSSISSPKYVKVGSHIIKLGGQNYNDKYRPMTSIHIKHNIPEFIWIMLKPYILLPRSPHYCRCQ